MANYSKWDKIVDSDEERDKDQKKEEYLRNESRDGELRVKDDVESWLRRQQRNIEKSEKLPPTVAGNVPEEPTKQRQYRRLTGEDRKVLAMFIVIGHFEDGGTNLHKHAQMLDMIRQHRWLEDDPGTVELLCRAHNSSMRLSSGSGADGCIQPMEGSQETKEDARIRGMCLSTINTLAAPRTCGCAGGLLELVNMICTPETQKARDLRVKWQKKEFAKDAVFDSLFPDMRSLAEEDPDSGWQEIWIFLILTAFIIGIVIFLAWGVRSGFFAPLAENTGNVTFATTQPSQVGIQESVSQAASAAMAQVGSASEAAITAGQVTENQKKIEELQRQIEELKRSQITTSTTWTPSPEL